jgi:ferredoxin
MYDAIEEDDPIYIIEPELCTECIGVYSEPACICVCPVDCIISDKDNMENVAELKLKRARLENNKD